MPRPIPGLEAALHAALTREQAGPPPLPAWARRPLLDWARRLVTDPAQGWASTADTVELVASNAVAYAVWQHGGGRRGVEALTVYGDRIDREFGVEAALRSVTTLWDKLRRAGVSDKPIDARRGRQRCGADNLTGLHRTQLRFHRLQLWREAGRLRSLEEDLSPGADEGEALDSLADEGLPTPDEVPADASATLLTWAASAWFWEEWERLDTPSFTGWLTGWLREAFGGAAAPSDGPHGGPAESNWRREATLQVRFRCAFCLGLGAWLEARLSAAHPSLQPGELLPPPDLCPAGWRRAALAILVEQALPQARALLEQGSFCPPGLSSNARRALLRLLRRPEEGRLYRVDTQIQHFEGASRDAREASLLTLARALGAAVARGGDMTGCGHDQERARLLRGGLKTGAELQALAALVERCPDCRAWWRLHAEAHVVSAELAQRVAAPALPARSRVWIALPAAAALALIALIALRPPPPVEVTTLAMDAAVAGAVLVTSPSGQSLQHPLREQDRDVQLYAPPDAWISLRATEVDLPDSATGALTLMAWAAADERVDLLFREALVRGADGQVTRTPLQPPVEVAVGRGVTLIVAVLPGAAEAIPPGVTPGHPTGELPGSAVVHRITVDPQR